MNWMGLIPKNKALRMKLMEIAMITVGRSKMRIMMTNDYE
jgi:hypothetical protein